MKKVIFSSDFFYEEFATGGAELTDYELRKQLMELGYDVEIINTRHLTPVVVDLYGHDAFYIISNFMQLKVSTMKYLVDNNIKYVIYEHDHKYLVYRNPSNYLNYKSPQRHILHEDFYSHAQKVVCQSQLQTHCLDINLKNDNLYNAGCSLWEDEFYDFLQDLNPVKNGKAAILESAVDHKNQADAISFCQNQGIPFDLVKGSNPKELATQLSSYTYFVFFPKLLETFCRVVAEAKMVGCEIITNARLGCASEENFSLPRTEYIQSLRERKVKTVEYFQSLIEESATQFKSPNTTEDIHFKIIVPLYNTENYIADCITSIKNQYYNNYECYIMDDSSTDKTRQIALDCIGDDKRFKIVTNNNNMGALENIVNGIKLSQPKTEDVIINLDGDDRFSHNFVLNILRNTYDKENCWLTYGSHEEARPGQLSKRSDFCRLAVPAEIIENNQFRDIQWLTSALRTFKFGLWDKINHSDLKNKAGDYYEAAWDLAYMFPMLEMAADKIKFIEEILYVYNIHESNDHHVPEKRAKQLSYEQEIRTKSKYTKIEEL